MGFNHTHLESGYAKATLSTEAPQLAVDGPLLGEFIEVVVRVPIDRSGAAQAVWGVPGDYTHEGVAAYVREAYPTVAAFVADWFDDPDTRIAVRLRARQGQDMLRDEFINIWEVGRGTGATP